MPDPAVGFIGLGTMGLPMAANLARAGIALIVHDASPAAAAEAGRLPGASVAASAGEVAARCAVLFTCLPNDDVVRRVYLGPGGIAASGRPGADHLRLLDGEPGGHLEVEAGLRGARDRPHGHAHARLAAPGGVGRDLLHRRRRGRQAGRDRAVPAIMGRLHMYVGGSSMANRVKLIHNGLAAATSVAVAEALAVCVQSGVDGGTFYEVVKNGGGMAYGTYFDRRAKRILDGEFSPTFMLELMRKDAGLALDLARSVKVPAPVLEETKRTYDEAVDAGWGKEDFSAVTHVVEKRIGRTLSG